MALVLLVPPFEVGLLIVVIQLTKIAMRIAMRFRGPAIVIADFSVIPYMVVGIVRVVNPIAYAGVNGTAGKPQGDEKSDGEQHLANLSGVQHLSSPDMPSCK